MTSLELRAIGVLMLVAALLGAWTWQKHRWQTEGIEACHAEMAKAQAIADAQAQETARATFKLQEIRDADTQRINGRLADALQRLRTRPSERVSPASAPASAGATGRELSGPDAGFLEREAARADGLRADLATCRGWIETVTGKVN